MTGFVPRLSERGDVVNVDAEVKHAVSVHGGGIENKPPVQDQTPAILVWQYWHLPSVRRIAVTAKMSRSMTARRQPGQ